MLEYVIRLRPGSDARVVHNVAISEKFGIG